MEVQKYADSLLKRAIEKQVHDIYFLPKKDYYELFFRVNQVRTKAKDIQLQDAQKLILHFKFRAGMNVGEKRRPQLGSFSFLQQDKEFRLRLSTVGDFEGRQSLVIRILHSNAQEAFNYFFEQQIMQIRAAAQKRGLFLFCGPTGSGKTSTAYHLAKGLSEFQQIIAIEDPVEIHEERILQLQVNEAIGMDYDSLIKLCLRHRPDLLIVGEIRDEKTARAVVRATLTGHSVFSTIHAKNIQGVYSRLIELGVDKGEIRETLNGIAYQRIFEDIDEKSCVLFELALNVKGGWSNIESKWAENIQYLYENGKISEATYLKEKDY